MIQRVPEQQEAKKRIGSAAASLVKDGQTLFLGSGSTVLEIARSLPDGIRLTVITNSLPIINELAQREQIEMIVIGGQFRQSELSMVGHVAEQAIREFRADFAFIGMHAIDTFHGFTNDFLPETMTDRAIIQIAHQVVVVADHTKFGRVSSVLVAPLTSAKTIITDSGLPEDTAQELQDVGLDLILV
jgi:DeoR/GlpR family transcriptional regulator of sugar metabolism